MHPPHLTIFATCSNANPCKHSGFIEYQGVKKRITLSSLSFQSIIEEIGQENVTLRGNLDFHHFDHDFFESKYTGEELIKSIFKEIASEKNSL